MWLFEIEGKIYYSGKIGLFLYIIKLYNLYIINYWIRKNIGIKMK